MWVATSRKNKLYKKILGTNNKVTNLGGCMIYHLARLLCCVVLIFSVAGCFAHPYVGRNLSSSFPHNKYQEGMPTKNSLCIPTTNGDKVYFHYTLDGSDGVYNIAGEMISGVSMQNFQDVKIYLLLVNRGVIVEAVALDTLSGGFGSGVKFGKTFKCDNQFRFITFSYKFIYY